MNNSNIDSGQINALFSAEAEQSVLGGLLVNPEPIHDVLELVEPDHFFSADHRIVFDVITKLVDSSEQVDVIVVAEKSQARTGKNFLPMIVELAGNVSGTSNLLAYARIIRDLAIKRKVHGLATAVGSYVLTNRQASSDDVINFAQSEMAKVEAGEGKDTRVITITQAMKTYVEDLDARFRRGDALNGMSSGFADLDAITNGWKRNNLIIIAARPSMGKTTYALQIAQHLSAQNLNGLFFSIEMSQNELTEKLLACVGHIPLDFLQNPASKNGEAVWPLLEGAARRIKDQRLSLIECPGIHINQLKAYARKAHRREKLDFIVVDHIHIMSADGQSRERELSQISGSLKALAGELNIPVFALAQLNRGVESRPDKQPRLSDLRDSGSIEQDADIIQLIYRDDYYNDSESNPNEGLVQIDTAKHRNGKKGKIILGNRYDQSRLIPTDRRMVLGGPVGVSNKLKAL